MTWCTIGNGFFSSDGPSCTGTGKEILVFPAFPSSVCFFASSTQIGNLLLGLKFVVWHRCNRKDWRVLCMSVCQVECKAVVSFSLFVTTYHWPGKKHWKCQALKFIIWSVQQNVELPGSSIEGGFSFTAKQQVQVETRSVRFKTKLDSFKLVSGVRSAGINCLPMFLVSVLMMWGSLPFYLPQKLVFSVWTGKSPCQSAELSTVVSVWTGEVIDQWLPFSLWIEWSVFDWKWDGLQQMIWPLGKWRFTKSTLDWQQTCLGPHFVAWSAVQGAAHSKKKTGKIPASCLCVCARKPYMSGMESLVGVLCLFRSCVKVRRTRILLALCCSWNKEGQDRFDLSHYICWKGDSSFCQGIKERMIVESSSWQLYSCAFSSKKKQKQNKRKPFVAVVPAKYFLKVFLTVQWCSVSLFSALVSTLVVRTNHNDWNDCQNLNCLWYFLMKSKTRGFRPRFLSVNYNT